MQWSAHLQVGHKMKVSEPKWKFPCHSMVRDSNLIFGIWIGNLLVISNWLFKCFIFEFMIQQLQKQSHHYWKMILVSYPCLVLAKSFPFKKIPFEFLCLVLHFNVQPAHQTKPLPRDSNLHFITNMQICVSINWNLLGNRIVNKIKFFSNPLHPQPSKHMYRYNVGKNILKKTILVFYRNIVILFSALFLLWPWNEQWDYK